MLSSPCIKKMYVYAACLMLTFTYYKISLNLYISYSFEIMCIYMYHIFSFTLVFEIQMMQLCLKMLLLDTRHKQVN